jgi:hypothetical protein
MRLILRRREKGLLELGEMAGGRVDAIT